jgi:hypothetical protein
LSCLEGSQVRHRHEEALVPVNDPENRVDVMPSATACTQVYIARRRFYFTHFRLDCQGLVGSDAQDHAMPAGIRREKRVALVLYASRVCLDLCPQLRWAVWLDMQCQVGIGQRGKSLVFAQRVFVVAICPIERGRIDTDEDSRD